MNSSKHTTIARTLLIGAALIASTLTTAHAESANATRHSTQHAPIADTQRNTDSRPDWNVDYPSQLGPQGVITSDAATVEATPPHKSRKGN